MSLAEWVVAARQRLGQRVGHGGRGSLHGYFGGAVAGGHEVQREGATPARIFCLVSLASTNVGLGSPEAVIRIASSVLRTELFGQPRFPKAVNQQLCVGLAAPSTHATRRRC
jgi:hypothetical protein